MTAIALAGPTASGKSAIALHIARALGPRRVEIISVDSAQVYRGLDIGTAKPDADERAEVPHHLIDIVEPTEAYSAARFAADAARLIDEITARGAVPLLVGGTMLYLKALHEGLAAMPEADPALRAEIEAQAASHGWPAVHAELAALDPVTAARLAPNDAQRIQRALEVCRLTGRPMSAVHESAPRSPGRDFVLLALEPAAREWLHHRIAKRFDAMLAAGFVDEVRGLRERGDLDAAMPSMRCVGYRQAWEALDAGDLAPLRDRGIAATRQLAKRQLTWLRSMPRRRSIVCDAPQAAAVALAHVRRALEQGG